MNSYFSRLIHQTEMSIGTGEINTRRFQPNVINPFFLSDEVGTAEPIEEIQTIVPLEKEQPRTPKNSQFKEQGDEEEKLSSMETQTEVKIQRKQNKELPMPSPFFNQDTAKKKDSSLPKSTRKVALSLEDSPQPQQLENPLELSPASRLTSHDMGNELNLPTVHPQVKSEKNLQSQTNVVQKTPSTVKSSQPSSEIPLSKLPLRYEEYDNDTLEESITTKPTIAEPKRQTTVISQTSETLPNRQVNLQTIREWFSETENSKFNTEPFDFPHPQPQAKQNFMLSIGTISLTVEAPQPEVKKPPLAPMKPQQKVKAVSPTSRINRHYLRL